MALLHPNPVLTLGYSPCPNDTFIFYALVHHRIDTGAIAFRETLLDVETLNQKALRGEFDVTKVSFHAYGYLRDDYVLIPSGGALGRGCGPLIVAREEVDASALRGGRVAVPGGLTTACLLLQLFDPLLSENIVVMPFDRIMDSVRLGAVDAGLIIHESRFTYPDYGLHEVEDLGKWWEAETGLPIPLGCIVAKKSLGEEAIKTVGRLIRESVEYANSHRGETGHYIKSHSRELQDDVIAKHIELYVNEYSLDLGSEGMAAVEALLQRAEQRGIFRKAGHGALR
jgi:1,4-dihydroxy-6-naphthoate synthase